MLNILDWEMSYVKQWLNARHLHLLRFVEEEIDKPKASAAAESDTELDVPLWDVQPNAQTSAH